MGEDAAPLLVLWDIDQTLLEVGAQGREAYAAAFLRATGQPLTHPWQFDGRTEIAAATEVMRAHGLDPDGGLRETFLDLIVEHFESHAATLAAGGRALPGAAEALTALNRLPGVRQTVLTGNLYPLAVMKMTAFDLAGHVDLRIGAYGGDAVERTDLPAHAFARAERFLGWHHDGRNAVVVGDTLRDIAAARAAGARIVAVATGSVGVEELAAAGADVVLPDLSDTGAVVRAVTNRP